MAASIFRDNAAKYHELGFNVIPVNGKRPVTPNWTYFCEHAQTETEVDGLVALAHGSTGLGIVLGHGVVALDIDTDDKRVLAALPESRLVKRGRTGLTAFYKTAASVRTKRDPNYPVELLAIGAQSVMPPSIHPDTKEPYTFQCSELESVSELTELVDPVAEFEKIFQLCKAERVYRTMKVGTLDGEGRTVSTDIAKESPIGRGGRNNYLAQAAYAKCCSMMQDGLGVQDIARELLELDERMFGQDAWFADDKEHPSMRGKTAFERALKFVERARLRADGNGDMKDEYKIEIVENAVELPVEDAVQDMMRDGFFEIPTVAKYQMLMDQIPFLESWSSYLVNEAESYSPALALGSGLSVLSACASNAFTFNKAAPNLYVMNIAPTGFGKDAPQRAVKSVLMQVASGGNEYLGFDSYDSGKGPNSDLAKNAKRVRVDVYDEVSGLFGQLNSNGNNPHQTTMQTLCKLWSAGRSSKGKNAVMDKSKKIAAIANPHLVWLGSTTPEGLQQLVDNQDAWDQGLVSRALFFIETRDQTSNDGPKIYEPDEITLDVEASFPPIILDTVRDTLCKSPSFGGKEVDFNQDNTTVPIISTLVPSTQEARQLIRDHGKATAKLSAELNNLMPLHGTHPISILLTRRIEMICRILACWFVGLGSERRVDAEAVNWAIDLMTLSQGSVVRYMRGMEKSKMQQLVERLKPIKGKKEFGHNLKARIATHLKSLLGQEPNPQQVQMWLRELREDGFVSEGRGPRVYYIWQ